MSITSYEPAAAGGSRVYDIAVSSAADAAQKLARIHRANDLLADSPAVAVASPIGLATKPEPNMSEPGGFIGPYQQNQQYIDNGQYDKVDPNYVVPQPQPKTEQPQPQTAAPNPSKPGQPGLAVPPDPEPVLKEATYTGPTMFDIGNSAPPNQVEGQPWVVQDPNLGKITNTIVTGTGGQTVDSVIEKPDGKTVTLRRVANGMGGYTMWMNAGGVMSVSYSPGTNGAAPGHILQYTMAEGDDPSNPSILSDLIDGGRTSVNLDTRTGTTWGTAYLDNGEQEVTVLSQDKVQQIYRTYHDEMGNPYTEQVGEIRPDMTGWYLGSDGLRRAYNPDHSVDVSGMDTTRTSQNLHISRTGQISGTLSNDVQARIITLTPNDTGSLEVTQDFRGKTLHITRYDLKGNPLRDWNLGDNGKWTDYTRNTDGSTTFNLPDGTKLQIKDLWRYTVWNPDGSHEDHDDSPKTDTRTFGQKLSDAAGNAWDGAFEKGCDLLTGVGSMSGFNSQYNTVAQFMHWNSNLPTQKIPFTNRDMQAGPLLGMTYGIAAGILKGVFDTTVADFKTAISAGEATGDWIRGKTSFADAAVRVWQEAAFDSINARSQFLLMTDLRGATQHPSKTAGELTFGALTLLLPTKGIGRGVGSATRGGVAAAIKATEATNAAIGALRRISMDNSALRGASPAAIADAAKTIAQATHSSAAGVARMMSNAMQSFRATGTALPEQMRSGIDRSESATSRGGDDGAVRKAPEKYSKEERDGANITGIIKVDAWIKGVVNDLFNGPPPAGSLVPVRAGAPLNAIPGFALRNWLEGSRFEQRNRGASSSSRSNSVSGSRAPKWKPPADVEKTPADFNSTAEYQVWLANTYPSYRAAYYVKDGRRRLTEVRDHTGTTPPHLVEVSPGKWDLADRGPVPFRPHYGALKIERERKNSSSGTRDTLDPLV
ncbi:hypothetical protein, partial [Nocardia seriolae]